MRGDQDCVRDAPGASWALEGDPDPATPTSPSAPPRLLCAAGVRALPDLVTSCPSASRPTPRLTSPGLGAQGAVRTPVQGQKQREVRKRNFISEPPGGGRGGRGERLRLPRGGALVPPSGADAGPGDLSSPSDPDNRGAWRTCPRAPPGALPPRTCTRGCVREGRGADGGAGSGAPGSGNPAHKGLGALSGGGSRGRPWGASLGQGAFGTVAGQREPCLSARGPHRPR